MMKTIIRGIVASAILMMIAVSSPAQDSEPRKEIPYTEKKEVKPFKVLTSGKRITIKSNSSNNNVKGILVWTASGHRIVEQHDLDVSSYVFNISVNEKIFFLLVEMKDGSRHTHKFGIE